MTWRLLKLVFWTQQIKPDATIDSSHTRYVKAVAGFCCTLCEVFIKNQVARTEHISSDDHKQKIVKAEEERIANEKAAAEKRKQEAEEKKAKQAAIAAEKAAAAAEAKQKQATPASDSAPVNESQPDVADEKVNGDDNPESSAENDSETVAAAAAATQG